MEKVRVAVKFRAQWYSERAVPTLHGNKAARLPNSWWEGRQASTGEHASERQSARFNIYCPRVKYCFVADNRSGGSAEPHFTRRRWRILTLICKRLAETQTIRKQPLGMFAVCDKSMQQLLSIQMHDFKTHGAAVGYSLQKRNSISNAARTRPCHSISSVLSSILTDYISYT